MSNVMIGLAAGLIASICVWAISMIATIKLRNALNAEARMELEEARSQDGYNTMSFLRRERRSISSEEDMEKRELLSTIAGEALSKMRRFIWRISLIAFLVTAVIVIIIRFANEI